MYYLNLFTSLKKLLDLIVKCCFLLTLMILCANISFAQSWIQLGEDIEGQSNFESSGYTISMSDDGKTLALGAPYNDEVVEDGGKARVYHWEASSWMQKGNDISGLTAFDELGYSVSLSADGNTLAVGAKQNIDKQRSAGYARILNWNGTDWVQMGEDILGLNTYDRFGETVSLCDDGNVVAVASRNGPNGEETGSVRIFEWNGSDWVQRGQAINGAEQGDNKGWALDFSADGNTLAVGTPQDGYSIAGLVQVFDWDGSNWVQRGSDIIGDVEGDRFGFSTSLSDDGNTLAVGARQSGGNGAQSGQLKVFTWNGAQWEQKGASIYGSADLQFLGWCNSISADGNTVAVGSPGMPGNEEDGKVQVYSWNNSQWELKGDTIRCDIGGNRSGWSVAISSGGDFVAMGTPFYTGNSGAGQVKVFNFGYTSVPKHNKAEFILYPNPVQDNLTIDLKQMYPKITLEILNVVGQVVARENFESVDLIEMNPDFPSGIYTVQLETEKGIIGCMKIIKAD
jgi:hypothetical protein